jgi:DNA-binding CsgD family transcriptional regulator
MTAQATAAGGDAVFVGRERELGVLDACLERAIAGAGSLMMVAGEAGIGKTQMLREFAATARTRGAVTLWGSSFEGDWHPPYGPWVEALGDLVRSLDPPRLRQALGQGAPVMARLLPELDAMLGAPPRVAALSPDEERFRLFEAVARFLVAVALWEPVVLVLDDLHWTDRDSLQLFAYCGRLVGRAPLVLVGAYRDVPPDLHTGHPLVDTLAVVCREAEYEHITLGGLSHREVADYLAAATQQELPAPLVSTIHAETGGNPFYVRQLWRHLVDEQVVVHRDGRWMFAAEVRHAGVPRGVRHVMARRLARLSPTASTVLRSAAALTAGFDFRILQTITELPEEVLLGCLDEAAGAGLIRIMEQGTVRYDFVHPIVRHTLYEELNPDRRARLHRRLAEALEQAHAERAVDAAAEIAVQYHASAVLPGADRGVEYALRAAMEATANTAHERAVTFLRIASDLASSREATVRADVRCRLALAEGDALLLAEAEQSIARALDGLAEAGAEPPVAAEFLTTAVRKLKDGGAPPDVCERFVRQGLTLLGATRDLTWARLMLLRDRFETVSTGVVYATRWLGFDPEAVELARRTGDEDDYAHTIEPFDWRTRQETAAVLELARRWQRPGAVIRALNVACRDALFLHGEFAEALARAEELLEVTTRYGSLPGQAEAVAAIAGALRASDLLLARQEAEQASELVARLHPAHRLHAIVEVSLPIMLAYYLDGDWADLAHRAAGHAGSPVAGRRGMLGLYMGACAALAYSRAGDHGAAERLLAALVPVLERMEPTMHHHTLAVHYCAMAAWELGWPRWAVDLRRLVVGLVEAGAGDSLVASHSLGLARMWALCGDLGRAAEGFAHARRDLDASGHRPLRAITDYDEALMLVRAGSADSTRIGALLADARAAFRSLGMAAYEQRATALGAVPAAAEDPLPAGLTRREAEVLRLISAGCTTQRMAETLIVSRATVERHITSLYRKIGARSRADATAYALRQGVARKAD